MRRALRPSLREKQSAVGSGQPRRGDLPVARTCCRLAVLVFAIFSSLPAPGFGQDTAGVADLRRRVQESVGALPWIPAAGYQLSGKFVYKESGEEIQYNAFYVRSGAQWVADFSSTDRSRNMRFALAGNGAWASSPELTADVDPRLLPYCAAYDFPSLNAEALGILDRGARDPFFRAAGDKNEIYVRGKLRNGAEATFLFNAANCFLRKVSIKAATDPPPSWFFLIREPGGSKSFSLLAEPSVAFELWFSDPVDGGGYRYPGRTDYVGAGGVVGSFFLEKGMIGPGTGVLFKRPPVVPWAAEASFSARSQPDRPAVFLSERELSDLRARLHRTPWSGWVRINAWVSMWARAARRIGVLFPEAPSLTVLGIGMLIVVVGALVMKRRRRVQFGRKAPKYLLPVISLGCVAVMIAGIASIQLHDPRIRSLFALHTAIRYAVTGNASCASAADALLRDRPAESPAAGIEQLARTCQAYAFAYDLIRPTLPRLRQLEIEGALLAHAEPLYGALQGWRSNTDAVTTISAGLGITALVTGSDSCLKASLQGLEKTFREQLVGGLHREGPGCGSAALNDAANFMFALKHSGLGDYYADPSFEQYIRSNLQLLSPVGTLPLFGETSLDQSVHLAPFLLKISNYVPAEVGRLCVSAFDLFSKYGRHSTSGLKKLTLDILQPLKSFFSDPYVLVEYEREIPAAGLPGASAVLGDAQAAVLRSGNGPDALFLALNACRFAMSQSRRDVLSFDLYAFRAILLHGAGFPGAGQVERRSSNQTAASNSITFNGTSQSAGRCSGVVAALLNQPVFDQVRVLADRTYEAGQVQRDVVLIRPDDRHSGYFLLIDEVRAYEPDTKAALYLHGRGELAVGLNGLSRWNCPSFGPPTFRANGVSLTAYPLVSAAVRSDAGRLLFEDSSMNQPSAILVVEWTGSKRLCTVLYPQARGAPVPRIEMAASGSAGRINDADWVSLGSAGTRQTIGPLAHASEYAVIRERGSSFPALLMVFGVECRVGNHSVASTKPVTISFDGLRGGIVNERPETLVEIRSPEIRYGDCFLLDGSAVTASEAGVLSLPLERPGEHSLVKRGRTTTS